MKVYTHITVIRRRDIEADQQGDERCKGQYPCREIDNKRPSPVSLSGVYLPLKVKIGDILPSVRRDSDSECCR
jgi:hypothetical protein